MTFYESAEKFRKEFFDYILAQDIHNIYKDRRHNIRKKFKNKPIRKGIRITANRFNEYVREAFRFSPLIVEGYLAYNYFKNHNLNLFYSWFYSAGPLRVAEGFFTLNLFAREKYSKAVKNEEKAVVKLGLHARKLTEALKKFNKENLESKI